MAEQQYVVLTAEDYDRIQNMLTWFEGSNPTVNYRPRKPARQSSVISADTKIVRVTTPTAGGQLAPAKFEAEGNLALNPPVFTDLLGDCWAVDPNGNALT